MAQLVEDQWLGQVVVRAFLEGFDGGGDRGVAGHHDDLDGFVVALDLAKQVEPAHLRHADVGDRCVEALGADRLERLGAGADAHHVVAPLCKDFLQQLQDRGFVVNYEDFLDFHVRLFDSSMIKMSKLARYV